MVRGFFSTVGPTDWSGGAVCFDRPVSIRKKRLPLLKTDVFPTCIQHFNTLAKRSIPGMESFEKSSGTPSEKNSGAPRRKKSPKKILGKKSCRKKSFGRKSPERKLPIKGLPWPPAERKQFSTDPPVPLGVFMLNAQTNSRLRSYKIRIKRCARLITRLKFEICGNMNYGEIRSERGAFPFFLFWVRSSL